MKQIVQQLVQVKTNLHVLIGKSNLQFKISTLEYNYLKVCESCAFSNPSGTSFQMHQQGLKNKHNQVQNTMCHLMVNSCIKLYYFFLLPIASTVDAVAVAAPPTPTRTENEPISSDQSQASNNGRKTKDERQRISNRQKLLLLKRHHSGSLRLRH